MTQKGGFPMDNQRIDRRRFLRDGSLLVAGAAAASALGCRAVEQAGGVAQSPESILNYNERMGYRRLGKTGIMISEVSLGGHGAAGYDDAAVDNRARVLERAAALGMNYVDTNIAQECELYGKALRGRRDNWYIGFASWPQKLTTEYEDQLSPERFMREIEGRLTHYRTDRLDLWRPVGATWGEGQTKRATMLMVSTRVLDMVAACFEKARQQGKVRWLGISAHNPKVFRRVLNEYPQFSVIIFPYIFLTKECGGDSLLALAQEKDVGVIGLKPFGAGTTFGVKPRELSGGAEAVDARAHVLVKEMLKEPRISAVIPGVRNVAQLEENVKGSFERGRPATEGDAVALRQATENFYAHLTPEYEWLRQWETV
jgi:aryl-alcohol dehydrogenase-like predicted oxidoreductase